MGKRRSGELSETPEPLVPERVPARLPHNVGTSPQRSITEVEALYIVLFDEIDDFVEEQVPSFLLPEVQERGIFEVHGSAV